MAEQPVGTREPASTCPILIGREREFEFLLARLAAREAPRTVVVRGEAGIGKTRLLREVLAAARARGATALIGRNVQHGQAPYRPLAEALLAAARGGARPDAPALLPFRHALGALIPDWREDAAAVDASPVVIGEGVLRLGRVLAGDAGAVLVVEDVHWADPDTAAALEYLADNLDGQPVTLLLSARDEAGAARDLVARLAGRGVADVLDLPRLDPDATAAMTRACANALDDEHVAIVGARAEGLPLLIEELAGAPADGLSRAVPAGFADAVARRTAALSAEALLVLQAAAVLGRRFDWRPLPAVTALEDATVARGLADGVTVGVLAVDADGGFVFRHGLVREAIVAGLLPPTRVALARRAAEALEAGPGADDDAAILAAELWCTAGERERAAAGLVRAGRGAVARGALTAGTRALERAIELCGTVSGIRADALAALTEALALAARVDDALRCGREALTALHAQGAPPGREARLHLTLARAAATAGRWGPARQHLQLCRAAAGADRATLAGADAVAALVALGDLRHNDAEAPARAALAVALELDLPEVACEALEALGRHARLHDLAAAEELFTREHEIARGAGLALWSTRALHELGTIDMLARSSADRLRQAGEAAYRAGALALAATVDLQLVGLHAFLFELEDAVAAGTRAVDVARTLGLAEVHVTALVQLGFAHALAGRPAAMEDAVGEALRRSGDHPETVALAWGHARATASLFAEDRRRAREELEIALTWARRAPGVVGAFSALSAVLRVVEGAGAEAVEEVAGFAAQAIPLNAAILDCARAALAARAGDVDTATARVCAAADVLRGARMDGWLHLTRRLLAEAALADGWGDPAGWLTEALAWFEAHDYDPVAAACRDLLRRAGAPSLRAAPDVPARLREAGVTARELDVLRLLGERLGNREIAERLYLSPRTVEKHVERLLHKTGSATRTDLARLAHETSLPPAKC